MTICIAALCFDGPHPVIVLCTDTKGSSHLGTTYSAEKENALGDDWACLAAGSESESAAMYSIFLRAFTEKETKDETNIVQLVQSCLRQRKAEKADDLIGGRWGMSFAEFRRARSEFPEDQYARDMREVANITLAADFIIAGFLDDGIPILLETDRYAEVAIRQNYCVIGEGAHLAQAALMHRDHTEHDTLARAIYCAFEAKKYAQRISTVGPETRLSIYRYGTNPFTITQKAEDHLAGLFEKYGPKDLVEEDHVNLPADFIESVYAHLMPQRTEK